MPKNPWFELKKEIAKNLKSKPDEIEESERYGDFAYPCFHTAKRLGKSPVEIAKKFEGMFKKIKFITAKAEGPYLNFYVDWGKFGNNVLKVVGKGYGCGTKKGRIMVEFAHPNTHKGFHVGHVRNICIGESVSKILEYSGYKVFRTNYQGDVGPHISKCLWGLQNLKLKEPKDVKAKGRWLGKVYAEACKKIKDEKEIKKLTFDMYEGKASKKTMDLWKKTRDWSLKYFDSVYNDFGVKFDRLYFESELTKMGKKYSKFLLKRGIAKRSQGAIVVDLKKKNLGVVVLMTKDGYALYNSKELGLAEKQFKDFNPDNIIHVVDVSQSLFFKQLFEIYKMFKPEWDKKSFHLSYEQVKLKEGKMSSRLGNVVLYDDLIEKIEKGVLKKTKDKKVARKIAMGALKYGMLKMDNERLLTFDWEKSVSLEGNTGPYLQYTHARACSILRKYGKKIGKYDASLLKNEKEIALLKYLARFPDVVDHAERELKPHILATYLYELCENFNSFYQSVTVLKAGKEKMARLKLVEATKTVLAIGLNLLGIEAVEKM